MVGDFNNIMSQEEKIGGNAYPHWLIDGFQQTTLDCDLVDLDMVGYPFTWERGQGTSEWTEVRLDRVMVNQAWSRLSPNSKLTNLEFSSSDHYPLFLEILRRQSLTPSRLFRFENSWLKEPLFFQIV